MANEEDPKAIYIPQTDDTGVNFNEVFISGSNLILQTGADGVLTGSTSLPNSSSVDALIVNNLIGNVATFSKITSIQITGSFNGTLTGQALSASYVDWSNIDNKPNLGEIQKVYYVAEEGDDNNNTGKTLSDPYRTIKKALSTIAIDQEANIGLPYKSSVQIKSGYYVETGSMIVPPFTSIIGDDLRSVVVKPTTDTKTENLFLMNNGTYVYGLRLEGCEIDDLDDPRTGFFFAFAPSASISTSPYVQNCSAIHAPQAKSFAPLDPDATPVPNPEVGIGPGGMLVDDSVLNVNSPLKSMVVDAYTQVAFNGIGICVRGRGYAQLVSFFTNFSRIGVFCIDGGHASLLNSNTTFGDFGLYSKGKRYLVVPDISGVSTNVNSTDSIAISSNKQAIIDNMIIYLIDNGNKDYSDPEESNVLSIRNDAGELIDALSADLLSAKAARTSRFTQGLFKAQDTSVGSTFTVPGNNAVAVFPVNDPDLLADFLLAFDFIRDEINNLSGFTETTKITQLVGVVKNTLTSVITNQETTFVQEFGSLITSTSHDFSYAGSGVNFLGLPNNQGGVGQTNFDTRIFQEDGGRVFQTSGDESGDFFAGDDFKINQSEGIIEGRAFARSLFALVTPFTLALENI
jgi:hypothetical protein